MPEQPVTHRRGVRLALLLATLSACSSAPVQPPLMTVPAVDLERFMGDWYVIANIPTPLERGAHNAVENYRLDDDGTIATTFTFRAGSFDGKERRYHPRGFVQDPESNAIWGMQFVWPVKADYRIIYLDPDYTHTVIGRNRRDYVWIMARQPSMAASDYAAIIAMLDAAGYDTTLIRSVPQRW